MAVLALETPPTLYVQRDGLLVAVVELVSPRNKDRPEARTNYSNRYAGYLVGGVHLLLIDVHPRPAHFSFADEIAGTLGIPNQQPLPPPMAVSYRVGEPSPEGAISRRLATTADRRRAVTDLAAAAGRSPEGAGRPGGDLRPSGRRRLPGSTEVRFANSAGCPLGTTVLK